VSNVDELSSIASDLKTDLILVTETWCNEQITDAYLNIPGYDLQGDLRKDRLDTDRGRGGGLLVYSKTGIPILSIDSADAIHQYCKFKVQDITFCLVYRSPSSGAAGVQSITEMVRNIEKNCVMIGDFNLRDIDWETGSARGWTRELLDAVEDRAMEQLVMFSTHIRGNTLDLVLTDMPERIHTISDEGWLGARDHSLIMISVVTKVVHADNRLGLPDWGRADWAGMKSELRSVNWKNKMQNKAADEVWKTVRDTVHELVKKKYVPERKRRNHNRPPWLTWHILREIKRKKRLWKSAKERAKVDE
jgi:hypothetical protein